MPGHEPHTLGRRQRLKDEIEWLDAYLNKVGGDRSGASIPRVVEILDQDGDFAFWLVPEVLAIKLRCVFQRADQEGNEVLVGGRVVDDPKVLGFLRIEARLCLGPEAAQAHAEHQRTNDAGAD